MRCEVTAPLAGRVMAMSDVPDPVFSEEIVGPGLALLPAEGCGPVTAHAPIAGRVVKIHPHAFVLLTDYGVGVLVHLGLDTVTLDGAGFSVLVDEGAHVARGDALIEWDPDSVRAAGLNPVVPMVVLDATAQDLTPYAVPGAQVAAGQLVLAVD